MQPYIKYSYEFDRNDYKYFRFSPEEYERRWAKIRKWMDKRGIDCLLVNGGAGLWDRCWFNIRYLTNYIGTLDLSTYCVFPRDGEITVFDRHFAIVPDRIARGVIDDIRGGPPSTGAVQRIKELHLEESTIGIVEQNLNTSISHTEWLLFTKEFPKAKFEFVTEEFFELQWDRTEEEIKVVESAAEIGDYAIEEMVRIAKPGATELDLFNIVRNSMFARGSEQVSMILINSTSMLKPDSGHTRGRPVSRTLSASDVILNEIGPNCNGYEAQTGKPICLGDPTKEYSEMFDICLEVYKKIVDKLRPGRTTLDVWEQRKPILDAGYTSLDPLLHGMLGGLRDSPAVFIDRPKVVTFKPNIIETVQVHVASPDMKKGMFLCDTFVVTDNAPRCLHKFPPKLTVVG